MTLHPGPILARINSPHDLRKLKRADLLQLAGELRAFILDVVSANPGHLGASLGVVELTIALHYLFNTPDDKLIWDVGHQAYGHKILTGRRDNFHSLRKLDGVCGFPVRDESEYDIFGTGHASTALSAALGMATAARMQGDDKRQHIAVVGDGAITGGMFFEALNHAGDSQANILIVLNDNGISIDKSAGALKDYLKRQAPHSDGETLRNPLFDSFHMPYTGTVDGNNLTELLGALDKLKDMKGPRLLHIRTIKGKGFEQAERDQIRYHAPGTFDRITGKIPRAVPATGEAPLYQEVFGETLLELAGMNDRIVAITPAMPTGSGLIGMMEQYPERTFDVGIAEQHAVTFAAGLSTQGQIPYCTIYSSFLQRAYDQVIHDVALQKLPVVFCVDRAGLVGEDGATHHGVFDLAYLRCIPNFTIAAPMNAVEFRQLLYSAQFNRSGPFAIRYPRGRAINPDWKIPFELIEAGRGRLLRKGNSLAIISIGQPGNDVSTVLDKLENEGIQLSHYDVRFLKPLDEQLLHNAFQNHQGIITVEDGVIAGGMGTALMEFAQLHAYYKPIKRLGIPDRFIPHGKPDELKAICGFDQSGIEKAIREIL
jgi:1-deoxy-D-xylulose-5-phosphate synthase